MAPTGLNEPRAGQEARWELPTGQAELLRFTTAGSVDDGKSTLIGRLLYDSKGVYEDQLAHVRKVTRNQTTGGLDLSLLTDGLRAEREQGITIDVAYRYFATSRRKFIIADTPGHEQYTRNMATGASTANLAIVLIDARHGVLPQSRRHTHIAALLAIPHIVVAVNKMDLVDFRQDVFDAIRREFTAFAAQLEIRDVLFIPISALDGDNVVAPSARTPWYHGPSLLEHLETVPIAHDANLAEMRFPVQYVIRPDLHFRGYAGQVASGIVRPGDTVRVLPSGGTTRVKSIVTWDGELPRALTPMSVTLCLEDELDISRGDMLVAAGREGFPEGARPPAVSNRLEATVVWMNQKPLQAERPYLVKHTTQQVRGRVREIRYRVDVNTLRHEPAAELRLNEIGVVELETQRSLFFDPYRQNRATGSFILIDPVSNETVGAGMISNALSATGESAADSAAAAPESGGRVTPEGAARVTLAERESRARHRAVTIWLDAAPEVAFAVERQLFDDGCQVAVVTAESAGNRVAETARALNSAGAIAICAVPGSAARERDEAHGIIAAGRFLWVDASRLPSEIPAAAAEVCQLLRAAGYLGTAPAG
jgi:sulfate adenylyltransferase large subunit